jgi:hypothetical protein
MLVFTVASVVAALYSAYYARRANLISQAIAEADLRTDVALLSVADPGTCAGPLCWRWAITNASRTGIVKVRIRAGTDQRSLDRESAWFAINRPSSPDYPAYQGTGLDWGSDALKPFETGYFLLPKEAVPSDSQEVFLRVSWREIRAKPNDLHITFRLLCEGSGTSGGPRYLMEEVDRAPGRKPK